MTENGANVSAGEHHEWVNTARRRHNYVVKARPARDRVKKVRNDCYNGDNSNTRIAYVYVLFFLSTTLYGSESTNIHTYKYKYIYIISCGFITLLSYITHNM